MRHHLAPLQTKSNGKNQRGTFAQNWKKLFLAPIKRRTIVFIREKWLSVEMFTKTFEITPRVVVDVPTLNVNSIIQISNP